YEGRSAEMLVRGDGSLETEPGGDITGADAVEGLGVTVECAMAEDDGAGDVLPFWRRPQHRAAFRREQPFVRVAGVPVRTERRHIERHLSRRVRAIHQHGNVCFARGGDDALD